MNRPVIDDESKIALREHIREFGYVRPGQWERFAGEGSREDFIRALIEIVREKALAPVSNFSVGAVGVTRDGALFPGVNLEFPGMSLTFAVHAEQAVVMNAMTATADRADLEDLAVSAPPCGFCRQFLYELKSAHRLRVLTPQGAPRLLTEFLPAAFGPADLNNSARLLANEQGALESLSDINWSRKSDFSIDAFVWESALLSARESYAPYSGTRAGVALRLASGRVFRGTYIENAAFNPSISPMAGALSNLRVAGFEFHEIEEALLLESMRGISQRDVGKAILASVSKTPLVTVRDGVLDDAR